MRNVVRQYGQSDGVELCQRRHPRGACFGGLRHGISLVDVRQGGDGAIGVDAVFMTAAFVFRVGCRKNDLFRRIIAEKFCSLRNSDYICTPF